MDGCRVMPMDEAAPQGDLFVTTTGCRDVLTRRHFEVMKNNAFLSNAGHFNVEVDCEALADMAVRVYPRRQDITGYELADGRTLNLLAEGRLVNLASGNGHPAEIMDTSFSVQALALEYLLHHASELGRQVYDIPEEIDREVSRLKLHGAGLRIDTLTPEQEAALWQALLSLRRRVEDGDFQPICLYRDGKPAEFSYLPIRQYGDLMENRPMESFSALMDVFYESREREERTRQRGQDLIRSVTSARDRCRRKLAQQRQEFAKCRDRDQLRISGELITANLYRMERGQTKLTAENYYDPDCREITIPLDPLLTPQQNAAKYYKRYTKARTAEKYLTEQMALAERDEAYLESVLEELRQAETEQDFLDIRAELRENGFLKRSGKEKKELKRVTKPREFRTSGGWRVLVGRNNRQNDQLTTKTADYRDLWLHTQKIHGSHVILCCQGQEVPEEDLLQAARLAACFSQAKDSANVPVDCAAVRYVKKPAGARPGMVTYTNARTLYVTPDAGEAKALSAERKGKNGGEVRN